MQLTLHTDYALRTLLYLTVKPSEAITVGDVAAYFDISKHHLLKVVQRLSAEGWVETRRGRQGGLRLAVDPAKLTVGTVVRAMEPHLDLLECFDEKRDECRISSECALKGVLHRARRRFLDELDEATIETMAKPLMRPNTLVRLRLVAE